MPGPLKCEYCDFATKTYQRFVDASKRLFIHYLYAHSDLLDEEKLICDQCCRQFVEVSNLVAHFQRRHNDHPKPTLVHTVVLNN